MIIIPIEKLSEYASLHPGFACAAEYAATHDLRALPVGRTDVNGDEVFIKVMEGVPGNSAKVWEAHEKYVDVQLILSGRETMGCGLRGDLGELNEQKDLYKGFPAEGFEVTLSAGEAAIFLPGEPHAPDIPPETPAEPRKKAVIKIRMR